MVLTPRERYLRAVRGEPVDRVPLYLEAFHVARREELDAWNDPGRREIAERIFPLTNSFLATPSHGNRYLMTPPQRIRKAAERTTADGVVTTQEIDTPKGKLTAVTGSNPITRTVWTLKYPCESLADIEKIRSVPWERPRKLAPEDLSRRPKDFDERLVSRTSVSSPFVCAAGMVSYEHFLELCATERNLLRELTAVCEERVLDTLDVLLAPRSIEYVWMGGCEWLTPPMGSPALYEELVQGPERRVIERIHAGGALAHIHCHGNVRSTLRLAADRGGGLFEPVEPPPDGDVTFAEAKALAAGRMTLAGNIEARVVERGELDEVEAAVRAAFEGGKERMVLATTAGPVGRVNDRVRRNYHRLIDLWEELSPM